MGAMGRVALAALKQGTRRETVARKATAYRPARRLTAEGLPDSHDPYGSRKAHGTT